MKGRSLFFGIARAAIGVALLVWVLSNQETLDATRELFTEWWLLPAAAALLTGGAALEAVRLQVLFRSGSLVLSWLDAFRVILIGAFFNFCIPGGTGGDVMKLYYLARGNAGRRIEVLTLLFADRFVSLLSVLMVIVAVGLATPDLLAEHDVIRWFVWLAAAILVGGLLGIAVAISRTVRENRLYNRVLDALPLSAYLRRALDALHAFRDHKRDLVAAFVVSLLGHGLLLMLIELIGSAVNPDVPWLPLTLLTLLGMLANVLPLTPGGLGVGEAAIDELFKIAGYGPGSPVILAWRISQIPLLIVGAILYVVGKKGEMARHEAAPAETPEAPEEPA